MDSLVPGARASPDGHSDDTSSSHSCEDALIAVASPCSVSPPPCTPQLSTEELQVQITPQMISAALEALTQAASQATALVGSPPEEQQLPDLISQALHSWISETATPPPTPNQDGGMGQSVSASDLIAALSSALSIHCAEGGHSSAGNSRAPSVPACTPQEGFGELARLGIQPEDVLHALNRLQLREISPVSPLGGEEEGEKGTALDENEEGEGTSLDIALDGEEEEEEGTAKDREEETALGEVEASEKGTALGIEEEESWRQDSDLNERNLETESERQKCKCDSENRLLPTNEVKLGVPENLVIKGEDRALLLTSLGDSDDESKDSQQENL